MRLAAKVPPVSDLPKRPAPAANKAAPRITSTGQNSRDSFVRTTKPAAEPQASQDDLDASRPIFLSEALPDAVAAALKGASVRLVRNGGEVVDLAVTPSPAGLNVTLGSNTFAVAVPFGADPAAVVTRAVRIASAAPPTLRDRLTGLETSGGANTLTLRDAAPLRITPGPVVGTKASYTAQSATVCFALTAPAQRDVTPDVVGLVGVISEQPAALRGALKRVAIDEGGSPVDEYWATTFNKPGFRAGGTAGSDDVTFWHAPAALDDGMITHEFGHLVSRHFAPDGNYVPAGWDEAIAADHASVSDYGENNGAEDFAESWRLFAAARAGRPAKKGDPATPAEFAARFPARDRILEAVASGAMAPQAPVTPSCATPAA